MSNERWDHGMTDTTGVVDAERRAEIEKRIEQASWNDEWPTYSDIIDELLTALDAATARAKAAERERDELLARYEQNAATQPDGGEG